MKKYILIINLILLFSISIKSKAQDVYHTLNGDMLITAVINDSLIKITTKELVIQLSYENAKFLMKMDKSNFHTGIDSLDNKLALLKYDIIEYKGQFGLDRINTNEHNPIDFDVEGVISTNSNIIKGYGHLEHLANEGRYSCLLTIKFILDKDDLGLDFEGLNIDNEIEIEIVQSVLNKLQDEYH